MAHHCTPDPGHGVFTTMLVVGGAPVALAAHLARLMASVRALYGIDLPESTEPMALERARGVALGRVQLSVTPGRDAAPCVEAVAAAVERATVLPGWDGAIALRSVVVPGWRGGHKWSDRRLLGRLDDNAAPAAALLLDRDGAALETTRASLFALGVDGVLRTPPADGSILPGVARGQILELAAELGVDAREERLPIADVRAARELFATGSVRGIEPVRVLDGHALQRAAGGLTARLSRELERRWLGN
jgi:para-aminobenzoate synthetase/4-amino-4-deoxychorismate lyase